MPTTTKLWCQYLHIVSLLHKKVNKVCLYVISMYHTLSNWKNKKRERLRRGKCIHLVAASSVARSTKAKPLQIGSRVFLFPAIAGLICKMPRNPLKAVCKSLCMFLFFGRFHKRTQIPLVVALNSENEWFRKEKKISFCFYLTAKSKFLLSQMFQII